MVMKSRLLRSDEMGTLASEGTRQLWAALHRERWSQNRLAMEIGVDSGQVNRWLHGTARPGLKWALTIKRLLGIDPESWNQTPKRPIVLRTGTDG